MSANGPENGAIPLKAYVAAMLFEATFVLAGVVAYLRTERIEFVIGAAAIGVVPLLYVLYRYMTKGGGSGGSGGSGNIVK